MDTPLIEAVFENNLEAVRTLLGKGADVNALDKRGFSPLVNAVRSRSPRMVALLLENGADVHRVVTHGRTAIDVATFTANRPILRLLYNAGAKIDFREAALLNDWTALKSLLAQQTSEQAEAAVLCKALCQTAEAGNRRMVLYLLKRGADCGCFLGNKTPLNHAADAGHDRIVELLLDHGADINALAPRGWSALMSAASSEENYYTTIKLLLERGADPNLAHIETGNTPLMFAASNGHIEILQLLLDAGAQVNSTNKVGENAWHFAKSGQRRKARDLLDLYGVSH